MIWLTGDRGLDEQIEIFSNICKNALPKMEGYLARCEKTSAELVGADKELFDSTILLQAKLHCHGCRGAAMFGDAYREYKDKNYFAAFMMFGDCAAEFETANTEMQKSEKGIWKGFFANDCFADYKHTAYVVRKLMGIVRELGDNASHWKWQREIIYSPADKGVLTLLLWENHLEDAELYRAAKKRIGDGAYILPIE